MLARPFVAPENGIWVDSLMGDAEPLYSVIDTSTVRAVFYRQADEVVRPSFLFVFRYERPCANTAGASSRPTLPDFGAAGLPDFGAATAGIPRQRMSRCAYSGCDYFPKNGDAGAGTVYWRAGLVMDNGVEVFSAKWILANEGASQRLLPRAKATPVPDLDRHALALLLARRAVFGTTV